MAAELAPGLTARELVPGNPDDVDRLAARLTVFADGMTDAGTKLGNLDAAGWRGPAAEAFSGLLDEQPAKFRTAGTAFGEASAVLRAYTSVLRRAQADAGRAVAQFEDASHESGRWRSERAAYDDRVCSAHDAGDPPPSDPGLPAGDPGADDRAASQRLLADAREQVRAQGRVAAAALRVAAAGAPEEPGLFDRVMDGIGDFFGGVWEGLKGLAETVVTLAKLSQIRMLIDPDGWARDMSALAEGLWWGITHPVEFFKLVIDWETWRTNPLRAFGKLIPDLAIAAATAGAGAAVVRGGRAVRTLDEVADGAQAGRRLPDPDDWPDTPPIPPGSRVPGGGLEAHEGPGRGHTIERHVGRTKEQLAQRLQDQPQIPGASTFPNQDVAEQAISSVIARNESHIADQLLNKPKVVLNKQPAGGDVGTVMARDGTTRTSQTITLVLRRDNSELGYHIVTAYPD